MRGKFVNLSLGIMNIIYGLLIVLYSIFIPQDLASVTNQELLVINMIKIASVFMFVVISCLNIVFAFTSWRDLKFIQLLPLLSLMYLFFPTIYISGFCIIAGVTIAVKAVKENIVELENMVLLSVIITIAGIILILCGTCVTYKFIGKRIMLKENEGELAYSKDFFKHVSELSIEDPYINVQRPDGKWRIY